MYSVNLLHVGIGSQLFTYLLTNTVYWIANVSEWVITWLPGSHTYLTQALRLTLELFRQVSTYVCTFLQMLLYTYNL